MFSIIRDFKDVEKKVEKNGSLLKQETRRDISLWYAKCQYLKDSDQWFATTSVRRQKKSM